MPRFAARTDRNHAELRDGLRRCGYDVADYSRLGHGCPDLSVLVAPGWSLLLEVKDPKAPKERHKLTEDEQEWMRRHAGYTCRVFTLEEALDAINRFKELLCSMRNI